MKSEIKRIKKVLKVNYNNFIKNKIIYIYDSSARTNSSSSTMTT